MKASRSSITLVLALAIAALSFAAAGAQAEPGRYQISSCASDPGRFSTQAYGSYATRGMSVRRKCRPGKGLRGMVVANVSRNGRVRRHARALLSITAAPGTVFRRFTWSGTARRRDCAYSLQLYATGPAIKPRSLLGTRQAAYKNCPKAGSQAAASKFGTVDDVRGATRITQRVVCEAKPGDTCSARGLNYVQLRRAEVSVQDIQPPSVRITGGSLFTGGWVNGERTVSFEGSDNLGIRSARVVFPSVNAGEKGRLCNAALVVPCSNGADTLTLGTRNAGEGSQMVSVQATDGSGLTALSVPLQAHIDNTPPTAVGVTAQGGDGWRSTNSFGANWVNPDEPDRAPITSVHYRICRAGGSCEDPRAAGGTGINSLQGLQVPAPGEWTLKTWREDAAGNTDERNASAPVRLRYDPEAPRLAVDVLDSADPTNLSASIEDALSGVASGTVEISREGSGAWQGLDTKLDGGHLRARVDDASLPAGRYLVRARGTDTAGNSGETDKRADGSVAVITLPLRTESRVSAGFIKTKTRRVVRQIKGKRRVVRRRVSTLVGAGRVRRNRVTSIDGRLTTADGNGLPNAAVYVFARPEGGQEAYAGTANTDAAGRYRFSARPAANETLRFVYFGAPSLRPSTKSVAITVPAQADLRVSKRSLLNGQAVRFDGALGVAPSGLPNGKLLELQTRLRGRWETFRAIRTDQRGRWRYAYRFTNTRGTQRYRFRVRVRPEGGYPFGIGTSRQVRVKVRGRR